MLKPRLQTHLVGRRDIKVETLDISTDAHEVLPASHGRGVVDSTGDLADLHVPPPVVGGASTRVGNLDVCIVGATNIHVDVLVGGKAADDRGVVIGTDDRGVRGHVVGATDGPAIKITLSHASGCQVGALDLEGLVVQPDLTDVAVQLKKVKQT